jgi:hypothetical protein
MGSGRAAEEAAPNARGWPILSHHVEASLEPGRHELVASDRWVVRAAAPDVPYEFLLHRDLDVHSLRASRDGVAVPLQFEELPRWRPRDFWRRPPFRELAGYAVAREIRVQPPEGGWGNEITFEMDYAGAVYDSLHAPPVAYSRGFEQTSGLIDPRGAYLHGQSFWVPWSSEDRFVFELSTTLSHGWESMSQGRRVRHERDGDTTRTTWKAVHPEESIYLVAGPYQIRERRHGDVEIYTYTYADTDEATAEPYLDKAAGYLDRYSNQIGPYPFAKWAMVENWWQTGFGMPSFTLLGDRVIRLPFIVDTSYGHEILHCWWGNGVQVRYDEGNWCEGLTAFGADYAYKEQQSEEAARDYRRDQLRGYLDFASGAGRDLALADFRERSDFGTQTIGYGKSMMVFYMLRQRLGQERFRAGLSEFYRRWRFRAAGWSDLEDVFDEVSGEDLGPWFDQWVDRPGAIQLALGDCEKQSDGWSVELRQSPPLYDAQVKVRWRDADGDAHDEKVEIQHERTVAHLPEIARSVELDPDFQIFRLLSREEVVPTLGQALGADSTLVVLGSAEADSTREALREVAESWAAHQDMRIVDESELGSVAPPGRSVYVLGAGPWADRILERAEETARGGVALVARAKKEGLDLVLTVRDPDSDEVAWTVLLPATAHECEALGRKIPHYSRYSWLLFRSLENVGKGQWNLRSTPMRRELKEES